MKVDRLATLSAFEEEDFEQVDDLILDLCLEPGAGLENRLKELAVRAGGLDRVRLSLPIIVRSWEEKGLRLRVKALREKGFTRFEVTNPASFGLLGLRPGDPEGLDLSSESCLHVVNRGAARELFDMGGREGDALHRGLPEEPGRARQTAR